MDTLAHGILGTILGETDGASMVDVDAAVMLAVTTLHEQDLIRLDEEEGEYHVTDAGREKWAAMQLRWKEDA